MMTTVATILREARTAAGLTQRGLAERAGTSQPAVARLERGDASTTVATLERLLAAAGFELRLELAPRAPSDPTTAAYRAGIDRTLLRENLRRSVEERLRSLADFRDAGDELERATRVARRAQPGRS